MNVLVIGQGIAGTCLAIELQRRGVNVMVVDKPLGETASRVAAGLVNPLTGRAFRPGWRQTECLEFLAKFYPETEQRLGGDWWQPCPIFRELETDDQLEIWHERQLDEISSPYAGPLFPWPDGWNGHGKAAYTRGSAVLHVEEFVNAYRTYWTSLGIFEEASVEPSELEMQDDCVVWRGKSFTHVVWCTGWEVGSHPAMAPLKGRPSKGTILDLKLPELEWKAGILHFGHWLVYRHEYWRFGATYGWSWDDPEIPEAPAIQELMVDIVRRYQGSDLGFIRARAAIRPIIRRSQPVAGAIPGLPMQYVFSGLGSKGVTTAPWTASVLASHLVEGAPIPDDLSPQSFWK
jgi:glycine/D-amino acid oxidase-like deaminating enzyme